MLRKGVLVLALGLLSTPGHATPPAREAAFWAGLDPAAERAPAQGVHALRPALEGRVRIEGGSFVMGSTPVDMARALELCRKEILGDRCDLRYFENQHPAHDVSLSAYAIDQREVRVDEYARCVSAGACGPPSFSPGDARFDRPALPITHVSWEDARAYCAWTGGRLPTEAEWEFAARGTTSREFPWGDVYNPHLCNHGALAGDVTDGTDGFVGLAPVGSFPDGATPRRIVDMAGNVAEWVSDYYDSDPDTAGYPPGSQNNPTGPASGIQHVIRGGSYMDGAAWMRAASRGRMDLIVDAADVGIRCAANAS